MDVVTAAVRNYTCPFIGIGKRSTMPQYILHTASRSQLVNGAVSEISVHSNLIA